MDIQNETILPTEVRREHIGDRWGHVAAFTKATYNIDSDQLFLSPAQIPIHVAPCDDAPVGEVRFPMEAGLVEVVCTGEIHAPKGEPASRVDVRLQWGDEVREIRAFGQRVWKRNDLGELVATAPELFRTLPMEWKYAYGGTHKVPAGFVPGTRVPMPTGEVASSANRHGIGFYLDAEQAEGQPLPRLEDPGRLIQSWTDRPEPVCFAPCPVDSALRTRDMVIDADASSPVEDTDARTIVPRAVGNAAPMLQSRSVTIGTRFLLEGMAPADALRFTIPELNIAWRVTAGHWQRDFIPVLVAVHIWASERRVTLLARTDLVYPLIREQHRAARLRATGPLPLAKVGSGRASSTGV